MSDATTELPGHGVVGGMTRLLEVSSLVAALALLIAKHRHVFTAGVLLHWWRRSSSSRRRGSRLGFGSRALDGRHVVQRDDAGVGPPVPATLQGPSR